MRDCKIIHFGYNTAISAQERTLKEQPLRVMDHPQVEKELNRYLSQGYYIVCSYRDDGMWFVLEREI